MENLNNENNNVNNEPIKNENAVDLHTIGAIIGLIVFVGAILATVKMGMDAYNKFKDLVKELEEKFEGVYEDVLPDAGFNDDFDIDYPIDDEETNDETITIDPYANHKNVKFAGDSDTVKNITVYIENGKVYSKNSSNGKKTEWKTVGTPKKILFNPPAVSAIVVTEEGKVYDISYDVCEELNEFSSYTIIDIARINNHTFESIYYLTSDGKLIDINGVSYDKYSFVNTVGYGKMWQIPVDKFNYGYHYDYDKDEYLVITNKSKAKVSFAKIYTFEDYILIQSSMGKLFKYDGESNVAKEESNTFVSRIERKSDGENTNIVVTFMDLSTKEYKNVTSAYDVKNNKEIDISKLTKYVEKPKVEIIEPTKDPVKELEKISEQLQKQILRVYDGKTMTGAETLATFQQHQNSDLSIVVVTKENGTAYTGKYKLDEQYLKVENNNNAETVTERKPYEGGVYYMGNARKFDASIKRTSFIDLSSVYNINAAKTYYTSLIKDSDGDAFGILFLER